MKDLVDLIERFRPGYGGTVEPASDFDIEDYEAEAGALPGAYRRFLQTMGRSIGDFNVHDVDFDVGNLVITYQVAPWIQRDQFLLIGSDRGPTGTRYFLDRGAIYGKDDCMVVTSLRHPTLPVDPLDQLHAGLEEFLYVEAYRTIRLPLFAQQAELAPTPLVTDPRATAANVCAVAERLGFERVPPAQRCALYERGDAALVLYRRPTSDAFSFRIGAKEPDEFSRLMTTFQDAVGVSSVHF